MDALIEQAAVDTEGDAFRLLTMPASVSDERAAQLASDVAQALRALKTSTPAA